MYIHKGSRLNCIHSHMIIRIVYANTDCYGHTSTIDVHVYINILTLQQAAVELERGAEELLCFEQLPAVEEPLTCIDIHT